LGTVHLAPTYPGGAAGLGFVGEAQRFFAVILIAYSVWSRGFSPNSVVYDNIPLVHFASAIAAYVIAAVLFILIPLFVCADFIQDKDIGRGQVPEPGDRVYTIISAEVDR